MVDAGGARELAAPTVQALPDALRRTARSLRAATGDDERARLTAEFRSLARMLRAGQPPLLLPHRSAPGTRRFGYVVDPRDADALAAIQQAHAAAGDHAWLIAIGRGRTPQPGIPVIDMTAVPEPQAIRTIAQADLDVLVDVDGSALTETPLLIAMHPARAIVERLFVPTAQVDTLIDLARRSDPHVEALPDGVDPQELVRQLDGAIREHRGGDAANARAGYLAILARYPDHPVALYLLGQLLSAAGQIDDAIASFRRASLAAPEFRDAHYALAQRLAERGEWPDALPSYARTVELTPGFAGGWSGLGLATLQTDAGRNDAVAHLQRAVGIEPDAAQWHFNLGTAFQKTGSLAAARDAYARAVQLDPAHRDARFNLGSVLQELGDYAPAIDAYRRVIAVEPSYAAAYPELGTCLQITGQVDAWLQNFHRYQQHCPPSLAMGVYGLEATMADGDVDAHARWLAQIVDASLPAADDDDFVNAYEQLLFLLLHVDIDRESLRGFYDRYDAAARTLYGAPLAMPATRSPGPMRIGYVSGDLRDHVMGRMIHEWVSRHDRTRFAVTLYSLASKHDAWTDRFRALDVRWVDLALLPLDDAGARIASDENDILIDCSGHTRNARPGIFARKPARIQATHIATPGPLGLATVDYKLTDALAEADDAQRYVIEQLMPVPEGVFPWHRYDHHAGDGDTAATPHARHQPPDAFVCGAFVSLMKLSPRCLSLWRRVLAAIPNAVLALSAPSPAWNAGYLRWLAANGIASDRVTFVPYEDGEDKRLARYAAVDVSLDPLPCGNVNGTMESLAMGVPVITLVGLRHGERLGRTLLTRFGITDTIAGTEDEYVAIAKQLASEPEAARRLRQRIRALAVNSAVWDSEAQVRQVEAVYARMMEAHSIDVSRQ